MTPRLCYSAGRNWGDAISLLILLGQDIDERDHEIDWTPLMIAAIEGCMDAVEALLAAKAQVDAVDLNTLNVEGETPLIRAIENGHSQIAQKFLDHGADVKIKARGRDNGLTPLHFEAFYGNLQLIQAIIDKGADVNALWNRRGVYRDHGD